jgi:segregation and condensation protein B
MLNDEILKALIEGIIYVAPEPVTLDAILKATDGEERERVKAKLDELMADYDQNQHGIQIRQVASGYKFSTKAEHHDVLRKYVKSLKPPIRLSKPALETLAVIAYRQPVTVPEIEEIRGVDAGGVIHTLMEKKLVVTAGRKNVVGRPILYRTSRDFLVHFGLKDVGELPSLKEFEELAKRALGSEWTTEESQAAGSEPTPAVTAEASAALDESKVAPEVQEPAPSAAEAGDAVENGESPEVAAPASEPSASDTDAPHEHEDEPKPPSEGAPAAEHKTED